VRILALAPPSFPPLALVPDVVASTDLATLRGEIGAAEVILVAPRQGNLLRELWPDAKKVRWVHILSAGVEPVLFEGLRESGVPLTNGRGRC
jgi:phosphoglycerate dehydrogenase-like enzyme